MLKLLALCFFTSLIHVPITEAKTRHYKWEVKYEYKSPDCFRKQVITINGTSPGPTISAQQGDTIIVEVNNRLITESFAIHWHGIRQVELYFPFSHLSFFFLNQYLQTLCMLNFSCLLICAIHHREERLGVMEQHG